MKITIHRSADALRLPISSLFRDEQARSVNPRSAEARKFCGFGALARAAQECGLSEGLLSDIFGPTVLTALIRVNNEEDHEAVLACLRELAGKK